MDSNATDFTKNDSFGDWASSGDITSTSDFMMPVEEAIGQKRTFEGSRYGAPPAKRPAPTIRVGAGFKWNLQALSQAAQAVETGGKSPVSALNELGVRVNYSIVRQGGVAHCPSFTVAVTVADMTFEGWGHSKREARASAARACLAALLARAGRVLDARPQDFTSDDTTSPQEFQCLEAKAAQKKEARPAPMDVEDKTTEAVSTPPQPVSCPTTALFGAGAATSHKSPINTLYESCPGLNFLCTYGDGSPLDVAQAPLQLSHSMRFKVICQIKDQTFEGYGSSKKLAKLAAARAALAVLEEGGSPPTAPPTHGLLPQTLADRVGKMVNEKFHDIMKGNLVHSKRKVLAGIVMTQDYKLDSAKVIAVTTGTKCVSGEHMSVRGRAVNDCHAEVAARRCLQRHLYAQLLMYAEAADPTVPILESDLEPVPGGGYQLKPDRRIHLYVSTAPCGDGRIFSPHEQSDPMPDRHPNRLARGQLRTKIESGEGTIPVKNCSNTIQTWDGVMQGERLLTMSCSDKVCRWCVVGLQGALLSRLLRPVYLHSLVLGSLLHPTTWTGECSGAGGRGGGRRLLTVSCSDKVCRWCVVGLQGALLSRLLRPVYLHSLVLGSLLHPTTWTGECSGAGGRGGGRRLLTVSCSDKVCRWCVVGLQGALLSRLLRPVYLHSLVLGSLLHPHHMDRAICGRIEGQLTSLPPPFRLSRPLLARAASAEARTPARAPSFSVCWAHTQPTVEVINAGTGKLESGQPSLLCKQTMFARWQYLVKKLPLLPLEEGSPPAPLPPALDQLLYNEAKQLCPAYQVAKQRLFEAFDKAKLGNWIKKPIEQDQFICEITDADTSALFA